MATLILNGQEVEFRVIGLTDDIEVTEAYYSETGLDLSDEDVDLMYQEHFEELAEAAMDRVIMQADFMERD